MACRRHRDARFEEGDQRSVAGGVRAINRQLKTESGKPDLDKVANNTDEAIEINESNGAP
jgi:hypothetical protein